MDIAKYICTRLQENGAKVLFGIPGTSCAALFDEAHRSGLRTVVTSSELEAGYAADGYARFSGLSVVCVSYGVGTLSLVNAIAGAYAERSPVVVLNGGPSLRELANERFGGSLYSHSTGRQDTDLRIFEQVTAYAVRAESAESIVASIDRAITTAIKLQRPVYLEIPSDLWRAKCRPPSESLEFAEAGYGDESTLAREVQRLLSGAQRPAILLGVEVSRYGCAELVRKLLEKSGLPYATTLLAKSALPETTPGFVGVYDSDLAPKPVRRVIEQADVLLCIGCAFGVDHTSLVTGSADSLIRVYGGEIRIRDKTPSRAGFVPLLEHLIATVEKVSPQRANPISTKSSRRSGAESRSALTHKFLFETIDSQLSNGWMVAVDTCLGSYPAADLAVVGQDAFIGCPVWLSIGHSVGAAIGTTLATGKPCLVICGDGGFQMTAQALSTIAKLSLPVTVLVLDNGLYAIEQYLLEPGYFEDPNRPPLPYVELNRWDYCGLADAMGIKLTSRVERPDQLAPALLAASKDAPALISIKIESRDLPPENQPGSDLLRKVESGRQTDTNLLAIFNQERIYCAETNTAERLMSVQDRVVSSRARVVVQKGRSFQKANPKIEVILDRGRYLVVDIPDETEIHEEPGCFAVANPSVTVRFQSRSAPEREANPAIQKLAQAVTVKDLQSKVESLAVLHTRYSVLPAFQPAIDLAKEWLENAGCEVQELPVSMPGGQTRNLVGIRRGRAESPKLYVVGAHLDSVNHDGGPTARAPGADDNASGSVTVVAIAEALKALEPEHDVHFVLFGGEEQGLFGSRAYVAALAPQDVSRLAGMINIDMAASLNTEQPTVLLEGAPLSQLLIDELAASAGTYTTLQVQESLNPYASDHVPFIDAGIPAVLTIEGSDGAYEHEHTERDTVDRLDFGLHREITVMNLCWLAEKVSTP